jgi:glycosyltransferase involved in cell wall biosynthesis
MLLFIGRLMMHGIKYNKKFKPDVVIASSTYPMDIFPSRKIAKYYKAALIYEVHDLWPLSPMQIGGYSKKHPFIRIIQRAENFAYKYCDAVVSLLPNAKEHMTDHGLNPNKFHYIPNGFDPEEWEIQQNLPSDILQFFTKLKTEGKTIVGYTGGHNLSNSLDYYIDAIKLAKLDTFAFVLVGKGSEKERLMGRCHTENIPNIYFLNPVDKTLIPQILEQMDILYMGWPRNPLYKFGISPNKLIDYMMAGKFVIHAVEAGNDPIKEAGCGISIEPENPETLAKTLSDLSLLNSEKLTSIGQLGKKYVTKNHTFSFLAKKFIDIIQSLYVA